MQKNEKTKKLLCIVTIILIFCAGYSIFYKNYGLKDMKQDIYNSTYKVCELTYPNNEGPFDCNDYAKCMSNNTTKEMYTISNSEQRMYAFASLGAYCGEITSRN